MTLRYPGDQRYLFPTRLIRLLGINIIYFSIYSYINIFLGPIGRYKCNYCQLIKESINSAFLSFSIANICVQGTVRSKSDLQQLNGNQPPPPNTTHTHTRIHTQTDTHTDTRDHRINTSIRGYCKGLYFPGGS